MIFRCRRPLLLPLLLLLGACGHGTSSEPTTPACSTTSPATATSADEPVVSSICGALGTRTSHHGVDVSVVGVQVALVTEGAEEDDDMFNPFATFESGTSFALRIHANDPIVSVGDLQVTALVSDRGERIEALASIPARLADISASGRDAIVYGRTGDVASAPTACLRLDGTLPVRLGSGTASATARATLRRGTTFELSDIVFEVIRVDFDPEDVYPLQIELRTMGELNRIRSLSFAERGVLVPSERNQQSTFRYETGERESQVVYSLLRRARGADVVVDIEATLFGEVRDVEIPIRLGLGVGLTAP